MLKKLKKIICLALCLTLIFEQTTFAQVLGQLDLSGKLAGLGAALTQEKFRPAHLRYLAYDAEKNNFNLLLDRGSNKDLGDLPLKDATKTLLNFFFIGLSLPDDSFWVNLRPDSPNNIIDVFLAKTDVGKVLLAADVQLKKDTALATSPQSPEGKQYWDSLYKKAAELFGYDNITIPTLVRPWIVPGEVIVRETQDNAYIYKATLKVMLEDDYLKDSITYDFKDPRQKALNEYASQLMRELIIPKLTREVNSAKRYAPLRQVYYSLILAQWFKAKHRGESSPYAHKIDQRNLTDLISKESWSPDTYFKQYQDSFKGGEYNLKETVSTPYGQSVRTYVSGGITLKDVRTQARSLLVVDAIRPLNPDGLIQVSADMAVTLPNAPGPGLKTASASLSVEDRQTRMLRDLQETLPARERSGRFDGKTIAVITDDIFESEGVHTYTFKLASMLASRNTNLTQIIFYRSYGRNTPPVREVDIAGSKIVFMPFNADTFQEQCMKMWSQYNIDLIVSHTPFLAEGKLAAETARILDTPFITYIHFGDVYGKKLPGVEKTRETIEEVLHRSTAVLAVGSEGARDIRDQFNKETHVVGPLVNVDVFNPDLVRPEDLDAIRKDNNISQDDFVVLFPNSFIWNKGPQDAIKAIARLIQGTLFRKKSRNIKMVFIGNSPDAKLLSWAQEYIAKNNLQEHFIFVGKKTQQELRNWYAASDVVLLPSMSEGFSLVPLEAMLMKKAVVAYNVSGIKNSIDDGQTGRLIQWSNKFSRRVRDLSEAVREIKDGPRETRILMGERGRNKVLREFDPEQLIQEHEKQYENALVTSSASVSSPIDQEQGNDSTTEEEVVDTPVGQRTWDRREIVRLLGAGLPVFIFFGAQSLEAAKQKGAPRPSKKSAASQKSPAQIDFEQRKSVKNLNSLRRIFKELQARDHGVSYKEETLKRMWRAGKWARNWDSDRLLRGRLIRSYTGKAGNKTEKEFWLENHEIRTLLELYNIGHIHPYLIHSLIIAESKADQNADSGSKGKSHGEMQVRLPEWENRINDEYPALKTKDRKSYSVDEEIRYRIYTGLFGYLKQAGYAGEKISSDLVKRDERYNLAVGVAIFALNYLTLITPGSHVFKNRRFLPYRLRYEWKKLRDRHYDTRYDRELVYGALAWYNLSDAPNRIGRYGMNFLNFIKNPEPPTHHYDIRLAFSLLNEVLHGDVAVDKRADIFMPNSSSPITERQSASSAVGGEEIDIRKIIADRKYADYNKLKITALTGTSEETKQAVVDLQKVLAKMKVESGALIYIANALSEISASKSESISSATVSALEGLIVKNGLDSAVYESSAGALAEIFETRPELIKESSIKVLGDALSRKHSQMYLFAEAMLSALEKIGAARSDLHPQYLSTLEKLLAQNELYHEIYAFVGNEIAAVAAEAPQLIHADTVSLIEMRFDRAKESKFDSKEYAGLGMAIGNIARFRPELIRSTTVATVENILLNKLPERTDYSTYAGLVYFFIPTYEKRKDLSVACSKALQNLATREGLDPAVYNVIGRTFKSLNEENPQLSQDSSFIKVMVSLKEDTLRHGLPQWRVYLSEHFQELTRGLSEESRYSIALSAHRLLGRYNSAISNESINKAVDLVMAERNRVVDRAVFAPGVNVVNILHQEERFEIDEKEALERASGVDGSAIASYKGTSKKSDALNQIRNSRGRLTVFFDGHGGENHIWLNHGFIGQENSETLNNPAAISYRELGDVLLQRGKLEEVVILISACYSYNFCVKLLRHLSDKGVAPPRVVVSSSNMDRVSYGDVFFTNLKTAHDKHGQALSMQDVFEAESGAFAYQDSAVFLSIDGQAMARQFDQTIALQAAEEQAQLPTGVSLPQDSLELGGPGPVASKSILSLPADVMEASSSIEEQRLDNLVGGKASRDLLNAIRGKVNPDQKKGMIAVSLAGGAAIGEIMLATNPDKVIIYDIIPFRPRDPKGYAIANQRRREYLSGKEETGFGKGAILKEAGHAMSFLMAELNILGAENINIEQYSPDGSYGVMTFDWGGRQRVLEYRGGVDLNTADFAEPPTSQADYVILKAGWYGKEYGIVNAEQLIERANRTLLKKGGFMITDYPLAPSFAEAAGLRSQALEGVLGLLDRGARFGYWGPSLVFVESPLVWQKSIVSLTEQPTQSASSSLGDPATQLAALITEIEGLVNPKNGQIKGIEAKARGIVDSLKGDTQLSAQFIDAIDNADIHGVRAQEIVRKMRTWAIESVILATNNLSVFRWQANFARNQLKGEQISTETVVNGNGSGNYLRVGKLVVLNSQLNIPAEIRSRLGKEMVVVIGGPIEFIDYLVPMLHAMQNTDFKGKTVIDYGAGSGVLGLVALRLGAKRIIAIDASESVLLGTERTQPVRSAKENFESAGYTTAQPAEVTADGFARAQADCVLVKADLLDWFKNESNIWQGIAAGNDVIRVANLGYHYDDHYDTHFSLINHLLTSDKPTNVIIGGYIKRSGEVEKELKFGENNPLPHLLQQIFGEQQANEIIARLGLDKSRLGFETDQFLFNLYNSRVSPTSKLQWALDLGLYIDNQGSILSSISAVPQSDKTASSSVENKAIQMLYETDHYKRAQFREELQRAVQNADIVVLEFPGEFNDLIQELSDGHIGVDDFMGRLKDRFARLGAEKMVFENEGRILYEIIHGSRKTIIGAERVQASIVNTGPSERAMNAALSRRQFESALDGFAGLLMQMAQWMRERDHHTRMVIKGIHGQNPDKRILFIGGSMHTFIGHALAADGIPTKRMFVGRVPGEPLAVFRYDDALIRLFMRNLERNRISRIHPEFAARALLTNIWVNILKSKGQRSLADFAQMNRAASQLTFQDIRRLILDLVSGNKTWDSTEKELLELSGRTRKPDSPLVQQSKQSASTPIVLTPRQSQWAQQLTTMGLNEQDILGILSDFQKREDAAEDVYISQIPIAKEQTKARIERVYSSKHMDGESARERIVHLAGVPRRTVVTDEVYAAALGALAEQDETYVKEKTRLEREGTRMRYKAVGEYVSELIENEPYRHLFKNNPALVFIVAGLLLPSIEREEENSTLHKFFSDLIRRDEETNVFQNVLNARNNASESLVLFNLIYNASAGNFGKQVRTFREDEKILLAVLEGSFRNGIRRVYKETASSSIENKQKLEKGGIDFRSVPITVEPTRIAGSALTTPPINRINDLFNDPELQEIESMINAGIVPSAERIREYTQACLRKENPDSQIQKVVSCMAEILRLQEERCQETESGFKDILVTIETKPIGEIAAALGAINTIIAKTPRQQ